MKNLLTTLCACGISFAALAADNTADIRDLEIMHSNVQRLALWVQPGQTLSASFAHICDEPGSSCTIFLDRDAKLSASHSTLGKGLTIYHRDSVIDALEFSLSTVSAKLIEGEPPYAAALQVPSPVSHKAKEVNHSTLSTFSGRVASGELLEASFAEICLSPAGPECVLAVEAGGQVDFSHSKMGERFRIASDQPLATGLSFHHTTYPYMDGPSEGAESSEQAADAQIVESLRAHSIPAETTARGVMIALPDVFFEFNKATLTADAERNVETIASALASSGSRRVSVEGHTDAVGGEAYNQRLSEARAEAVRSSLARRGIAPQRMTARGFGKSRPVADNADDLGRAKNRRVEIILERSSRVDSTTDRHTADLNRQATTVKRTNQEAADSVEGESDAELHIDGNGIHIRDSSTTLSVGNDGVHLKVRE